MDLSTIGVFAFLDGLNGPQTGELVCKSSAWVTASSGFPRALVAVDSRRLRTC
jgi:hypothetical protein